MATATMTIKTLQTIAPMLQANISTLIRGNHGIGKSQIGRQIATTIRRKMVAKNPALDIKTVFPVIDRRLSQQTEGDLLGLPSTDDEVTRWNPPDWYKKACNEPVFLFLDELNRATTEVMQAAFQIVLDRELNGWRLHPETRVMSAINSSAAYTVNEIDPALLDRFWVVDLNATLEDWLLWARSAPDEYDKEHKGLPTNIPSVLADFIAQAEKWLDPNPRANPGTVDASRRSWDRLALSLVGADLIDNPTDPNFYQMCLGFVGTEAAIAFKDFAQNFDKRVSGKDLVDNFDKVKGKLAGLGPEQLNIAIDKITDHVRKNVKALNAKQGDNIGAFIMMLPGELRLSLWSKLTQDGTDKIELARSVHQHCAKYVLEVFGVPMGEAGIGIMPNIPGIFKKKKEEGSNTERFHWESR